MSAEGRNKAVAAVAWFVAAILGAIVACKYFVIDSGERANERARKEAASRPVAPPPPKSIATPPEPPVDVSKLVTAAAIEAALSGTAKAATTRTASGMVTRTFADLPGANAIAEKASPERSRVTLASLPPEGLGPSELTCVDDDGRTFRRITAGPLLGRFFVSSPKTLPGVMTEEHLRHVEKGCARTKSCRSSRGLKTPIPPDFVIAGACQVMARRQLKAPSQARFPDIEQDGTVIDRDCIVLLASHVDAPNVYNAMLRTKYICAWDPQKDETVVRFVDE